MDDTLKVLADRVKNHVDAMATEEAVKTAVVLPFLHALGYDVFNPREVVPEFTADAVGKKGEKVDYAIKHSDEIKILVECKPITCDLNKIHLAQLFRYFTVTSAKFAILTNGRYFHFHTDIEEPNKLDVRPFLVFDLLDLKSDIVLELKKFQKSDFDVAGILSSAERLKYTALIKAEIGKLFDEPSDEFVRLICGGLHEGSFTRAVRERFAPMVKIAYRELLRDSVQARLSSALANAASDDVTPNVAVLPEDEVVTTPEEIEGFMMVRAIVRDVVKANRIYMRDQKSYCGILVDDNNRKPLTRLHFNSKTKYISLFDQEKEDRVKLETLDSIYDHADRLRATAVKYTEKISLDGAPL